MTREQIAIIAHEANRAYCKTLNDHSQSLWITAEPWQRESTLKGVESILSGDVISPEQFHGAWMEEKIRAGWVWGPAKDKKLLQHPCMIAYALLPPEQRVKDAVFFAIVKACQPEVV